MSSGAFPFMLMDIGSPLRLASAILHSFSTVDGLNLLASFANLGA